MTQTPHEAALAAIAAGLCTIPPAQTGTKQPLPGGSPVWAPYQKTPATVEDVNRWYGDGITGVGYVTGEVSGNLEVIDFDDRGALAEFEKLCAEAGIGGLLELIKDGYFEHSPNGAHLFYRCDEIAGNQKLAKNRNKKAIIETRGEGGYIVAAPTYGSVNASGSYVLESGGVESITTIEPDDRAALHSVARMLDESIAPADTYTAPTTEKGGRPGDAYNAEASWADVLEPHDWVMVSSSQGRVSWRRPGKDFGISATTNHAGSDLLYVFTTSTGFDTERGIDKFGAYATLNHGGDTSEASRQLALLGYGQQIENPHNEVDLSVFMAWMHNKNEPAPTEIVDLLRVPGLVGDLADWINEISIRRQPVLALAASIAAVATVIGRKVRTRSGLRSNIYILGVGETGCGKDAARVAIKRLFSALGKNTQVGGMFASDSSIETALDTSPSCLYLIDEMGLYLGSLTDKNAQAHTRNIIRTLMEVYTSSSSTYFRRTFADAERNKENKPIEQPCLNLYGTTVPINFYGNLAKKNCSDGLLGRLLVFESDAPDPYIQEPAGDETVPQRLVDGFKRWSDAPDNAAPEGNIDFDPKPLVVEETKAAARVFERLEADMRKIRARVRRDGGDHGPYMRIQATAKKLALIRACGIHLEAPEITEADAEWGSNLAWCLTKEFLSHVTDRVVENKTEEELRRVLDIIRKADGGLTKTQITRKTQWAGRKQRDEYLLTLRESGEITATDETTGGRAVTRFKAST